MAVTSETISFIASLIKGLICLHMKIYLLFASTRAIYSFLAFLNEASDPRMSVLKSNRDFLSIFIRLKNIFIGKKQSNNKY